MDRILNMLLRLFLRRGINLATRKGVEALARRQRSKGDARDREKGKPDQRLAKTANKDARRIRQMMRVARRITRL